MQTFKEKLLILRKNCYKNGYLFAAFCIPLALMIAAYISFDIWPFGTRSVLSLDLNAQYVFYFDYMHDVFAGKESLFYCWSRNLSGEFMGIIGYYLASPFNILVWLFPRTMITEGLLCMILAKFGVCGATFAFYAHKSRGVSKTTAVIFAPMYAMCAYMIVQTMNPMWLDGVLILPIVCYGIESLVRENRFRMLVGALVYAFVANFYIGFMIAIFTVLYFIYFYFANAKYDSAKRVVLVFVQKGAFTGVCGIVAAMISGFMILPVYNSLQNGKLEFTVPDYSLATNFDFLKIAQKLFPNTYDTVRMEGLPFIFCGSVVLILAAGYFCSHKFGFAKKLSAGLLIGVLLVCMYIRPVDMIWHGGQMPNWLPYRYSFMVSFVMVMLAAQMFEQIRSLKARTIGFISVCYIGLVLYVEAQDTFMSTLGSGREVFDGITVALPAVLFIVIAGVMLYFVRKTSPQKLSKAAVIAVVAVISGELCFNTTNTLSKMNTDIVFSTRDSYLDVIVPLREKVDEIKAQDDGFYRIEKNFFRSVNDPMATGMYGLSHSSSTLNAKAIDMLGCFGFTSNGHYTRFSGNTPLTSDIFGVKYILDTVNNSTADIKSADDIKVTENTDALPIAYLTDISVKGLELSDKQVFLNQSKLLSCMAGTYGKLYFEMFSPDIGPIADNCTMGHFENEHIGFTNAGSDASVIYRLTAPRDGEVYMYIPTDYQREVNVYVNGSYIGACFEGDNHNIKKLGTFKEGDSIELKLKLNKQDLYYQEPQFAVFDTEAEASAVAQLSELNRDTVCERVSGTEVKISVNADRDRLLFTTIPAEDGWTVYVDGKQTDYVTVLNDSLMAVELSAGQHTVEFKFIPDGLIIGLIIMACGILIFVAMIVIYLKLRKPVCLKTENIIEVSEIGFGEDSGNTYNTDMPDGEDSAADSDEAGMGETGSDGGENNPGYTAENTDTKTEEQEEEET